VFTLQYCTVAWCGVASPRHRRQWDRGVESTIAHALSKSFVVGILGFWHKDLTSFQRVCLMRGVEFLELFDGGIASVTLKRERSNRGYKNKVRVLVVAPFFSKTSGYF
jgi:hypothetical protein